MIVVTQIVNNAAVSLQSQPDTKREIQNGLIVFLGIAKNDTEGDVDKLVSKLLKLRIFPDENQKINLDIQNTKGEVLLISQFTLLGNLKGGNRPDFGEAADKDLALNLYQKFTDKLIHAGIPTQTGYFGEYMNIKSDISGPMTIILDSNKI